MAAASYIWQGSTSVVNVKPSLGSGLGSGVANVNGVGDPHVLQAGVRITF